MYIEVTEKTFYLIFKNESFKTEKSETHETQLYKNEDANQFGKKVWNFASSKQHQYYLEDINA